jgi:hypothetical protein
MIRLTTWAARVLMLATRSTASSIACGQAEALLGGQWNHLPLEFGDRTTVYRAFVRWEKQGIFDILWAILLTKCDELQGVDWHWQAADGCLGKARGVPGSGLGKRGVRTNASVPTPVTVASRASRRVSWSKAMAGL